MLAGCDSTVTLDLTIFDADATVTTDTSAATIMASNISSGVSYQWIFCASGMPVTNETNQSFTPINKRYTMPLWLLMDHVQKHQNVYLLEM